MWGHLTMFAQDGNTPSAQIYLAANTEDDNRHSAQRPVFSLWRSVTVQNLDVTQRCLVAEVRDISLGDVWPTLGGRADEGNI